MATKDLAFLWSLSVGGRQGLFTDASRILFRVGSLISMVYAGLNDVLESGDLSTDPTSSI